MANLYAIRITTNNARRLLVQTCQSSRQAAWDCYVRLYCSANEARIPPNERRKVMRKRDQAVCLLIPVESDTVQ